MDLSSLPLFIVAIITSSLTVILLKSHMLTQNKVYVPLAIISELILVFSYMAILNNSKMNIMYPLIKIMSILIVVPIGILLYDEQLNFLNIIGVILGILALLLLSCK